MKVISSTASVNKETLAFYRSEGLLLDGDHLAMRVDEKVDADEPLTEVEAGILMHGITEEQAAFVLQHLG